MFSVWFFYVESITENYGQHPLVHHLGKQKIALFEKDKNLFNPLVQSTEVERFYSTSVNIFFISFSLIFFSDSSSETWTACFQRKP